MAVEFTKEGFTVRADCACPESDWLMTCYDIIDAATFVSNDIKSANNFYYMMNLLRAMLPDEEQLKKLIV